MLAKRASLRRLLHSQWLSHRRLQTVVEDQLKLVVAFDICILKKKEEQT